MPRILSQLWTLLVLLFAGQALALGLGDIRLNSALNEPLRAEIELLAAVPEELDHLTVQLASAETFERYGLDRPLYLGELQFDIFKSGATSGNLIRVTSLGPVSEPFVTFLVEAQWSRGRLLREYTVLLDPPTFAPPPLTQSTQAVTAPTRSTEADAGRIERPASRRSSPPAARQPAPVQAPAQSRTPEPSTAETVTSDRRFDNVPGGDIRVARGDTLWGIASRNRPDERLSINQMMMALFEANPDAFSNNINLLRAGATLSIPSADAVYRISRGEAFSAVQQQNEAWEGGASITARTVPSLTLVPPDEDQAGYDDSVSSSGSDYSREFEIEDRIQELEAEVPTQDSLIEIHDNELAQLRAELALIRGEEPVELPPEEELPVVDVDAADGDIVTDDEIFVDDATTDTGNDNDLADGGESIDAASTDTVAEKPPVVVAKARPKPSLLDTIFGLVLSIWGAIAGAIIVVLGILVWFARRAGSDDDDDSTGVFGALDADDRYGDKDEGTRSSTQRLESIARTDDSTMIVEEQDSAATVADEMATDLPDIAPAAASTAAPIVDIGASRSIEDTFSSDTAINLDQSDPIAEADFHMAYGLHDQAADLINGALELEPDREDLLAKLCEVYFVWGNRDAFVGAAEKMQSAVGEGANAEWDKIVIMGQQIAGDHEMFSGKSTRAATEAVDHSFEGGTEEIGALDMDFAGGQDGEVSDIIDLGVAGGDDERVADPSGIDFVFDEVDTSASVTQETPVAEATIDTPAIDSPFAEDPASLSGDLSDSESTVETPTIEQQFDMSDATAEVQMPSDFGDNGGEFASFDDELLSTDATAEIDLDELGLDLDALVATGLGADYEGDEATIETGLITDQDATGEKESPVFDDVDATGEIESQVFDDADATGEIESQVFDDLEATGKNLDLDETDTSGASGLHSTADIGGALEASNEEDIAEFDETGRNLSLDDDILGSSSDDLGIDTSLLDATGQTQILSEDFTVETTGDVDSLIFDEDEILLNAALDDDDTVGTLSDDVETMLAPLDDEDREHDKTEAIPVDIFAADPSTDETGELPDSAGSTDLDLDLDDLTAAIKISEVGDTVNQQMDDATVEQPRPGSDLDLGDSSPDTSEETQALPPDALPENLDEARTMTEVGTKLDLARAYVDMGDPAGARSILEEVVDEGDEGQRQQAKQLLDSLPS